MSHVILLKVTKFQWPLLITLGVADEKAEAGKKPPPRPPPFADNVQQFPSHLQRREHGRSSWRHLQLLGLHWQHPHLISSRHILNTSGRSDQ